MKKLLTVFLCFIMAFTLSACAGTPAPEETTTQITTTTTVPNTVRITFPEGFTVTQIAQLLERNRVCASADFVKAVNNADITQYDFLKGIDNHKERAFLLEGYIFPDTYEFYFNESAEKALSRFLENTERKLTEDMFTQAENLGYTMDEILTIASLIQKEADIEKEMGKVSSVFHNRLNASYNRLESDVTIHYIEKYVKPFIEGDKNRYNELYNTYKCYGLPAGPICNPGIASIKAALNPEETDYMFFFTDKDMNYYYSKTYKEHKDKWNNLDNK